MTIVVADSSSTSSLSTYSGLLSAIASWSNRPDLVTVAPDFVALAESAISRDLRLRKQIVSATLSTTSGTRGISIPADWLESENVSLSTTPGQQLSYVTVEQLDVDYPENGTPGKPAYYTVEGDLILFGPTPDAAYPVNLMYYAAFPSVVSNTTNWLLTTHPGVYLHRCLYLAHIFLKDEQRAAIHKGLYEQMVKDLQAQDDKAQHSGSVLRVRRA